MKWSISTTKRDRAVATLAGLIVLFIIAILCQQSTDHLVSPGTWVNLGKLSLGQTAEKAFTISNFSSKPIEIVRWAPSCHCMQVRFAQTIVRPHEISSGYISTTASMPLGSREAVIAIEWRYVGDQIVRTDNLVASVRYLSLLSLSEERLDFGNVPDTKMLAKMLYVRQGNDAGKWNDLEVKSDSNNLSVRIRKELGKFQIESLLDPSSLPMGIWKDTIRIHPLYHGNRTGDEVDVPVVAKIEGPFSVSPSVISYSSGAEKPFFFSLNIRSKADVLFGLKFLGNVVQNPKIVIASGGKEAIMTGTLTPLGKGLFVGKIPILINNDPTKILQVSYVSFSG